MPIPAPADLGNLQGLQRQQALQHGHQPRTAPPRYHANTGIVFNTLYPGCVADSVLFRDTPKAFQTIFPWFQKNITKGCVTQQLAGECVAQPPPAKAENEMRASRLWDLSERFVGFA